MRASYPVQDGTIDRGVAGLIAIATGVCQHVDRGRGFAGRAGGDAIVIEGAGHLALARNPVKVNLAIKRFTARVGPGVST